MLDQTDADNYWITKENVELRAEVARLQQEWDEAEAEWMKHGAECEAQVAQLQQMLSRYEG